MLSGTAPRPFFALRNHSSTHCVSLHIGKRRPGIGILQRTGEETILPQMPGFASANRKPACVVVMHAPDRLGQSCCVSRGRDQVNVIGHQAVPQNLHLIVSGILSEQRSIEFAVSVFKEHIPPIVSTLGYVMRPAGQNHPSLARHTSKVLAPRPESQNFGVMVTCPGSPPDLPVPDLPQAGHLVDRSTSKVWLQWLSRLTPCP